MSREAVTWALECSASRGLDRLVLIVLAHHRNHLTGACYPSMRTIAREAGISLGKVAQSVATLVAMGELEVAERGDQRRSARYDFPPLSVHVVNAARAPGVNAARAPGVNRTTSNPKEPEGGAVVDEGCAVIQLRRVDREEEMCEDGLYDPALPLPEWMQSRDKVGSVRALRAASRPPDRAPRVLDRGGAGVPEERGSAPTPATAEGTTP